MTDLERVRDTLMEVEQDVPAWREHRLIIDAHLKEDAEREDRLMDAYTAMDERDAELARLREQLDALEEDGPPPSAVQQKALLQENARLREDVARLTETNRFDALQRGHLYDELTRLREQRNELADELIRVGKQRDTLLAAGKRYLYALSVANGTTGPDDRQDALEGLEAAISEVEGTKGGPSAQGR